MKSGTARKVQDLRPAVDQQRLSKGEKRRQGRQKPSIVPAVHSAERGEHQRSRGSLPELHPDLWGKLCWLSQSAAAFPHLCLEFEYNDGNKDVPYSDIISARPGAVDVTFRYRKSRICASSSKRAVRTQQTFVLFPAVNCAIKGDVLWLFFCVEQLPACTGKGGPPFRRETALLLPGQRHRHD